MGKGMAVVRAMVADSRMMAIVMERAEVMPSVEMAAGPVARVKMMGAVTERGMERASRVRQPRGPDRVPAARREHSRTEPDTGMGRHGVADVRMGHRTVSKGGGMSQTDL